MRHHIVTRIVVLLAVLWVAAVVIFAWRTTRPVALPAEAPAERAGPTGEALFARHCATCHEAGAVGTTYREAPDREAAAAAFRAFLVDHYEAPPDGIALIVSYVMDPEAR